MPPITNSRGDQSFHFFNTLKIHIFQYQSLGKIFICGDFNARCGNKIDSSLSERLICDSTNNMQGLAFVEFLEEIDFCMLNGRFGIESNKYTSVSYRGSAVVDYCITATSDITVIKSFKIILTHNLLDLLHIPADGNIPDHSFLFWEIKSQSPLDNRVVDTDNTTNKFRPNRQSIDEQYLGSDKAIIKMQELVSTLSTESTEKSCDHFKSLIVDELPIKNIQHHNKNGQNKPKRFHKVWWNGDLSAMHKEVKICLNQWLKYKLKNKKIEYIKVQKGF